MKKSGVLGFVCPKIALVSEWRVYQAQEGMQGNKHRGQCSCYGRQKDAVGWEMKWKDLKHNNKNKFVLKNCSGRFFSHSCLTDSHIEARQNNCAIQLF